MKKLLVILSVLVATFALTAAGPPATAPTATIDFVNPPDGVIAIADGEAYTATFTVESDTQWLSASLIPDPQFPGRIVGNAIRDSARADTSAELSLTWTGNTNTTNTLGEPVPVNVFVAIRYPGNVVIVEQYTIYFEAAP